MLKCGGKRECGNESVQAFNGGPPPVDGVVEKKGMGQKGSGWVMYGSQQIGVGGQFWGRHGTAIERAHRS